MTNKKKPETAGTKTFKMIAAITLLCLSFFFLTEIFADRQTQQGLRTELADAKAELAALQAEKDSLQNQKEKLSDVNYISSVARGKYLISTSNEQIYVLPSLDE